MSTDFRIQRIPDYAVVKCSQTAARLIVERFPEESLILKIYTGFEWITTNPEEAITNPSLGPLFKLNGATLVQFQILRKNNYVIATLYREFNTFSDRLAVEDAFHQDQGQETRALFFNVIRSSMQEAFGVAEFSLKISGVDDNEWAVFRRLQIRTLARLEEVSTNLIEDFSRRAADLEQARDAQYKELERQLRTELQQTQAKNNDVIARQEADLQRREKELKDEWAKYNTEQSGLEARSLIQKQVTDLIKELSSDDGWKMTPETKKKRYAVAGAYLTLIGACAFFTYFNSSQSYSMFASMSFEQLKQLPIWTIGFLALKSILPFGAFATFMVYFIRWLNGWARLHADEEFQMRARLIDIRRAGWLLEAVRDANEKDKSIPDNLLRELARNLFTNHHHIDDTSPQALHEIVKSLTVDIPNGGKVVLNNQTQK